VFDSFNSVLSHKDLEHVNEGLKLSVDEATRDKQHSERLRQTLAHQLDELRVEHQRLQSDNIELQRSLLAQLADEKEDLHRERARLNKEQDKSLVKFLKVVFLLRSSADELLQKP
jgi:ABC-type phosphate transport system auxiliary subunit